MPIREKKLIPFVGTGKKRFLGVAVAICTKPMRWFAAAHCWLQHVSDRSFIYVFKLIILALSALCFELSNFFFKCAYLINLRRMRLAGIDCAGLGLHDEALKIKNLGITLCRIRDVANRSDDIERLPQAADSSGDIRIG